MFLPIAGLAGAAGEALASLAEILAESLLQRGVQAIVNGGTITVQLSSTALESASYEPASSLMQITFTGGREYDFPNADQSLFEGLVTSSSPGSFYNQNIKGQFGGGIARASGLTAGLMGHFGR